LHLVLSREKAVLDEKFEFETSAIFVISARFVSDCLVLLVVGGLPVF